MEVLSQSEINELLRAINASAGETKPRHTRKNVDDRKIRIYDFKRPNKFFKEHLITFSSIFETFCRLTTISLSSQIRSMSHIHIASVDQLTYDEFIRSIPTATTLAIVNMSPLKGNAVLEIDPAITFSIIDRICGGCGDHRFQHELTDIELPIMEKIIVRMLDNIRESWTTVLDLRPQLVEIDTNPQSVRIVPPNEPIILITMETKIGDVEGMINFCIPYLTVEPIMEKLSSRFWYGNYQNDKSIKLSNLKLREEIPVRLTAEALNRDYPFKEILKWKTGTLILPQCRLSLDNCYLRLGDRRIWKCQILPDDSKKFLRRIKIIDYTEQPFGTEEKDMKTEEGNSLTVEAMSNVMIKISVELGTAFKTVKEVYAMGEGTIIELDKFAGEPIDIKANGILFAHGEVVVVDENFGVRISEIAKKPDSPGQKESA